MAHITKVSEGSWHVENGDAEYFILKEGVGRFYIRKMNGTLVEQQYTILMIGEKEKLACSCPSGIHRGTCKHTSWIREIK